MRAVGLTELGHPPLAFDLTDWALQNLVLIRYLVSRRLVLQNSALVCMALERLALQTLATRVLDFSPYSALQILALEMWP